MAQSNAFKRFVDAGGQVLRDGDLISLASGDAPAPDLGEIAAAVLPDVTDTDRLLVKQLLAEYAGVVHYICSEREARAAVAILLATPPAANGVRLIGFDTETMVLQECRQPVPVRFTKAGLPHVHQPKSGAGGYALDPYRSKVRLLQLFGRKADGVFVLDMNTVDWATVKPVLTSSKLVAANAIFDVIRLLQAGIVPGAVGDPLRAAALTHGLVGMSRLSSLAIVTAEVLGIRVPKELARSDWGVSESSADQIDYAALDPVLALLTYAALTRLMTEKERQVRDLVDKCIVPTARMELAGIPIDSVLHRAMYEEWQRLTPLAEAEMLAAAGGQDLTKPRPLQQHLRRILTSERRAAWPRTTTGQLMTRKDVLRANADLPAMPELLAYRKLVKLDSAFGSGLAEWIHPVTGRLHPHYHLAGASTGRFAVSQPPTQQLPKRDKFRHCIRAAEGWAIVSADLSQIELRAAGRIITVFHGRPSTFDTIFSNPDADVHGGTAARIFRAPRDDDEKKAQRDRAKVGNFGLLYGMGVKTFHGMRVAEDPTTTLEESKALRDAWRAGLPDVVEWQRGYTAQCRHRGYTETIAGRRWYDRWNLPEYSNDFPPLMDLEFDSGFRYCASLAHRVQGSCAEVLQAAILLVDDLLVLLELQGRLISTLHDEIIVECPNEEVGKVREILAASMTHAWRHLFGDDAPSHNLVGVGSGQSWGEAR